MRSIAHVINPVHVTWESDLTFAQPITFESMRQAKEAAKTVHIELYTTSYPEDHTIIPDYFQRLPDLERSVLDLHSFTKAKKYPLISDILTTVFQHTAEDFLVFTNVDIGLMPGFYDRVGELLTEGHDALIINRRGLPVTYRTIDDLPAIYQDKGVSHPGFDCFVFHRSVFPKIRLDQICVGIPYIGVTLAHNLFCFADHPKLIDDEHLTFHLGTEVMPKRDKEYYWYNRKQFERIRKEYLCGKLPGKEIPIC